ncbi:MAG: hypothetical protein EBR34_14580 [Sphingomonadaceae bacterium]|nr:hypothetical protein [Sphingomonadaceae bacterium]
MVGAGDNAVRAGYEYAQRATGRAKGDASAGRFGADLDRNVDQLYRALGATPPSQMSQDEREFDQNRRSIALNVLLAPATPGLGAAGAATRLGLLVRGAGAFGINEMLSTFLDDNRGSNVVNLINQMTGAKLPGAVNVGKDDRFDSAVKSLVPNALAGVALGAAVGGGVALGARGIDAFRNIRRNIRADRAVAAELRHRARQQEMGLLQKDEADGLHFTPDAQQPPAPAPTPAPAAAPDPRTPAQQVLDANAAMEQRLGGGAAPAEAAPTPAAPEAKPIPTAEFQDPTQPGADMGAIYEPGQQRPWDYDPSLPESTALGKSVEELSDSELQAVLSSPGTPVVERVNQAIEARAAVEPGPGIDASMVMAPTDRLADDYIASAMRRLGGREDSELRPLFDPQVNSGLWQRAQALTGVDDVSQLSKADMLDAIQASAADGQMPIVNRLMGGQMLPTGEITAAPKVFQYKQGVNAAGEQLGNSLSGVERWDPNAEGIIQVWRDANGEIGDPGRVYVVNGHNRLAAANRMGIPSMRVEYLDAPTAAEARLQGAIANVSDGKGTVFDAAKLAREYGINDPAQLKAMGKPGASGFWKDGIALGRLPEDVFRAAVDEQIPVRRAVIIGESGVDEETMRSAYRYLVQQGADNVKEGTLREMLAMAQRSPASSSADQPDILTGTEWAQNFNQGMLAKADLAGAVRLMLSKEKKLFGTVGRQAGQIERVGQVDAGAAKDISGEASRALTIFDQLKYETGPVGDLLNEGTQRVLAGESAAQVAKGIKNRLAASIQEAMGKEVAPAVDVVQEDMFAAAGRAADEPPSPVELTPEQRNAAEAQLLHEAIAAGEVRPPDAPIPDLPAPAQVRLDEIDLNASVTPGSKAAQALADEARLSLEHARMDAAMQDVQEQAAKDGIGYENLTFDQKKEAGTLGAGLNEAITPEVMPPEGNTSIADLFAEQARQLAQSDARLYRRTGEALANIRAGLDALADPTLASAPARPIEIPPAAGKRITPRTSESNIRSSAESLASWTREPGKEPMSIGQALGYVRAKGSRLDPDAVPGLNMDAARNEASMGMSTPNTEAVAQAYRQFYGLPEPAPKAAPAALAPAPARPRPLQLMQSAQQPELLLPQDLRRAAPRYGRNTIAFQSDLDRAAYVLANDAVKPSKAAGKFRQVVQEAGLNLDEVVAHGKRVKAALKQAAKGNPGEINLPAQAWRNGSAGAQQRIAQRSNRTPEELLAESEASIKAIRAELNPKERIPELIAAWRKVVGDDVRIRILDTYKVAPRSAAWGGDGEELDDIAGMYQQWKDTIHIYQLLSPLQEGGKPIQETFTGLLRNGFHESFHRIVRMAMTDKDLAVLNTRMARFKAAMAMSEWGADRSTIAYDELVTEAAAKVFTARHFNQDPVAAVVDDFLKANSPGPTVPPRLRDAVVAIVRPLNKVYDFIEKTVNLFRGRGFESISTVFEKAARAEMTQAIPSLQLDRITFRPVNFPGIARQKKVGAMEDFSWNGRPVIGEMQEAGFTLDNTNSRSYFDTDTMKRVTKADATRTERQIADLDQQMADIRRKAEQEGC